MKTFDVDNKEMCNAYDLIAKTNLNFFLTGRAGTGKTTFLQKVQESIDKNFVVVAPTGVAAIQAGGQTIHSFFGLGLGVLGPQEIGRVNREKIRLFQEIDTIIMDEVSMVRCDTLDAVDRTLRHYRQSSQPFGGVQMVFVGDLFQLPPVAKTEDIQVLQEMYGSNSFFFYMAWCLKGESLPKIEFQKVYRQNDPSFIALLDKFRKGRVSDQDLQMINSRVVSVEQEATDNKMRVILTSYRNDARMINENRLNELSGNSYSYDAIYEGDASRLKEVADKTLVLKEGAQVMFLRNDPMKRWANGTIAHVKSLSKSEIVVSLGDDDYFIGRETWESFEYEYDETNGRLKKTVVGTVNQYPLRLAWAITIHKSQSLTFENVAIDFGKGAFTYGQAYVALSRATSLSGIELFNPIDFCSVKVSREVQMFAESYNDQEIISKELAVGEVLLSYEKRHDYDGAATMLFSMCREEARCGRISYASELLNRALSYLADDSCLYGCEWEILPIQNKDSIILNAAGLLYSGNTDQSIRLLTSIVSASDTDLNGLYLLARALEDKQDWETVKTLYQQMLDLFQTMTKYGMNPPCFRKFKYRLAILNERHFGNSGIQLLKGLIAENPYYDKYHTDLRWIMQTRGDELPHETDDKYLLVNLLTDKDTSEKLFLKSIQKERKKRSDAWFAYRRYILNLNQ